jgi:transcriptional regulator with XRE-family HTH domain
MELTGQDCRIARRRRGVTLRDIAPHLGVTPQRAGQIEQKPRVKPEEYNRYTEAVEAAWAQKVKAEYALAGGTSQCPPPAPKP